MAGIRINGPFGSFEMPISGKKDNISKIKKVDNDKIVKERKENNSKDQRNSNESFDRNESNENKKTELVPNKKLNVYLSGQTFCPTYTKEGTLEKEEATSSFDISI